MTLRTGQGAPGEQVESTPVPCSHKVRYIQWVEKSVGP